MSYENIIDIIERACLVSNINIELFNYVIRKFTHLLDYLILRILVINVFKYSGIVGIKAMVITLSMCILYAISDEVHQLFVDGRGGQVGDVVLDGFGALVGTGVYYRKKVFNWLKVWKEYIYYDYYI